MHSIVRRLRRLASIDLLQLSKAIDAELARRWQDADAAPQRERDLRRRGGSPALPAAATDTQPQRKAA